jgi:hypothetical protein
MSQIRGKHPLVAHADENNPGRNGSGRGFSGHAPADEFEMKAKAGLMSLLFLLVLLFVFVILGVMLFVVLLVVASGRRNRAESERKAQAESHQVLHCQSFIEQYREGACPPEELIGVGWTLLITNSLKLCMDFEGWPG